MLKKAKEATGIERTLACRGIREALFYIPTEDVMRAIEEIDDPEMLRILIGAGAPGRAYHFALAKLRLLER